MQFRRKINLLFLIVIQLSLPIYSCGICTISKYIYKQTFLLRYLGYTLTNNSKSTQERPFRFPKQLPSAHELGKKTKELICKKHKSENIDKHFLIGASTSEHQCSKKCTPEICSWSRFAKKHGLAQPTDKKYPMDLWKHYKSYFDDAKRKLGINSLRFSIEWALVQPEGPDNFDQKALDHYADMFVYAIKKGITPVVCFHHYTDPCWFLDAGGFEKEKNIPHFVKYCTKVYSALLQKLDKALQSEEISCKDIQRMHAPLFATFNSPEGYAFKGYRQKYMFKGKKYFEGPSSDPKKKSLKWVAIVLKNLLESHVQVYHEIHKTFDQAKLSHQEYIGSPKVGFLKNITQLDPAYKTWLQWLAQPLTKLMVSFGNMLQNETIYQFFTTGLYKVHIPTQVNIEHFNAKAKNALDFIGLNYYSNRYMFLNKTIVNHRDEKNMTDNDNYGVYPHGLYRAVVEVYERLAKQLNISIYPTEGGIATMEVGKRNEFYHRYLAAIFKLIKDDYPVGSYLTWTLGDNYEWQKHGSKQREYGLCTVDSKGQLHVKEGAGNFVAFAKGLREN